MLFQTVNWIRSHRFAAALPPQGEPGEEHWVVGAAVAPDFLPGSLERDGYYLHKAKRNEEVSAFPCSLKHCSRYPRYGINLGFSNR